MDPLAPKTEDAPAAKPAVTKPKKVKTKKKSKTAKTKKKPAKKTKTKTKKKPGSKGKKTGTQGGVVRSERLDMRLSKAEKANLVAKAKKKKRTITSLAIEAIAKIK